ncbi:undecaprenyl-phosphate glucose phosphotransferase [Aureimonas leprariae]|uniref:Undecaprenyl-phosphate glucose phosphotransferase n=2 Tax=Plantimonas leprariae TaxID=2615207 RepID=A0A7V7TXM7_9HYPH|nr:undecaprenyl-phosphate glucose phosphotransferase [Aureimonas leprariae]
MLNQLASETADRYASRVIAPAIVSGMLMIAECVVLAAISIAVIATADAPSADMLWRCLVISVGGAVAGVCGIHVFGGYEIGMLSRRAAQIVPVASGWAAALAAIGLGLLVLQPESAVSRAWLSIWYVTGAVALLGARMVLAGPIRRWKRDGVMERRAVIVGGGQAAEELIRTIIAQPDGDVRICGIFDDRGDRRSPPLVAGYPKLGNIRELVEFARTARIDMLIVTLPLSAEKRVLEFLKSLWVLPLDIRLAAHAANPQFRSRSHSFVGQVPVLDVFNKPIADWNALTKRVFDILIASAAIVALSPVFLATAIAVRLDSKGPIFFRQKRHGFNNQVIEVFKFRSMYHEQADPAAKRVVTKGDPRVTRVGRFIRKSSIDELPQLWNVVRGELSLVGPRPHAVHAFSSSNEAFIEIVDDYFGRHKVKPGITGWAQVNGYRGEIDQADKLRKRFEYDLHYIDNWSILFDVAILARTPLSLLKTENAY